MFNAELRSEIYEKSLHNATFERSGHKLDQWYWALTAKHAPPWPGLDYRGWLYVWISQPVCGLYVV